MLLELHDDAGEQVDRVLVLMPVGHTPGLARQAAPGAEAGPAREAPIEPAVVATLDEVQAAHIRRVLALTGARIYGKGGAAQLLGLKPSTLQSRMKKLGLGRMA